MKMRMKSLVQPKKSKEVSLSSYPTTISFDETDLPQIKKWKVNGKYTLTLEVEMLSIGKDEQDKENEQRARFKVLKVGTEEKEPKSIKEATDMMRGGAIESKKEDKKEKSEY